MPPEATLLQGGVLSRRSQVAVNGALLLVLAWLMLHVIAACMTISPEFDGAMNLLESRSIAEGQGPRAVYDSNDLFPPGVQTKEPYVLLGALVFRCFGVGPLQIELPNLLFLIALCGVAFVALRRMFDTTSGLMACVLILAYPRLLQYGLRGYGEVPTLCFGLAALALVAWPDGWPERMRRRCLWAGVCAGLAVATKVVGLAQVAVVGIVLACRLASDPRLPWRDRLLAMLVFGSGVLAPLLLVEAWRWYWLKSDGYRAWWAFQWMSIQSQSGAATVARRLPLAARIAHRFLLLCTEFRLGTATMLAMLLAPVLAVIFAYATLFDPGQRRRSRWWLLGLLMLGGLYFAWWFAIVPEEKAWVRYIYIGLLVTALLAAIAIAAAVRFTVSGHRGARWILLALGLVVAAAYAAPVARALHRPVSFADNQETTNTMAAARLIARLPRDAVLLGYGWYGAPSIQIHSARRFMDLSDYPIGRLAGKTAYLVADRPTLTTRMFERTLARYPHQTLRPINSYAQVYLVDFAHPRDPFTAAGADATRTYVEFAPTQDASTYGMEPFDPIGGRFVESDSEILLRYTGQDRVRLVGYMDAAVPSHYRWPGHMDGRVIVGDCPAMPFRFDTAGWRDFILPMTCTPPSGRDVRVRILLDNVLDLPLLKDRQRAMLLNAIGFVDATAANPTPAPG